MEDLDWLLAPDSERADYILFCVRFSSAPPRDSLAGLQYERTVALAKLLITHRVLRVALEHYRTARDEAAKLAQRAADLVEAAQAVNVRADSIARALRG